MKHSNNSGFTLLEAVIALVLATSGIALAYQSFTGAAKIQAASREMTRTRLVAMRVISAINAQSTNDSGITDGIAWSTLIEPIARNKQGTELLQVRVLASGPSGREVQLVHELIGSSDE